jgi:hypothetical protein
VWQSSRAARETVEFNGLSVGLDAPRAESGPKRRSSGSDCGARSASTARSPWVGLESHRSHQGETQRDGTLGYGASDHMKTWPGSLVSPAIVALHPRAWRYFVLTAVISTEIAIVFFLSHRAATLRSGVVTLHRHNLWRIRLTLPSCQPLGRADPGHCSQLPIICGLNGTRSRVSTVCTASSNFDAL